MFPVDEAGGPYLAAIMLPSRWKWTKRRQRPVPDLEGTDASRQEWTPHPFDLIDTSTSNVADNHKTKIIFKFPIHARNTWHLPRPVQGSQKPPV